MQRSWFVAGLPRTTVVIISLLPTGTAAKNATAVTNKKAGIKHKYAMFNGHTISSDYRHNQKVVCECYWRPGTTLLQQYNKLNVSRYSHNNISISVEKYLYTPLRIIPSDCYSFAFLYFIYIFHSFVLYSSQPLTSLWIYRFTGYDIYLL